MSFIFVFYLEGQNEKQHEHFFSASSSWIRVQLGGDWIGLHNTRLGYTDSTLWWFTQNLTLRWVTLYFTAVGPFWQKAMGSCMYPASFIVKTQDPFGIHNRHRIAWPFTKMSSLYRADIVSIFLFSTLDCWRTASKFSAKQENWQ